MNEMISDLKDLGNMSGNINHILANTNTKGSIVYIIKECPNRLMLYLPITTAFLG
jgi:hypothetical protein